MQWVTRQWGFLRRLVQAFGPYLLIEILLPGGSLIALMLYLHQHRRLPFGLDRLVPARGWIRRRA
jgi:hypothetical protein